MKAIEISLKLVYGLLIVVTLGSLIIGAIGGDVYLSV